MTTAEKLAQLDAHSARVLRCGGPKAVEKQHALGKRTARERIELLMDTGTFTEVDRFVRHRCTSFGMGDKDIPADGVVTGYGKIDGRTVFVYAQDFTAQGGSLGEMHAAKICKIMDMALEAGCPVVGLCDPAAPAFRRRWTPCPAMGRFSTATPALPDVSRRSPPSWVPARAARSTPPP